MGLSARGGSSPGTESALATGAGAAARRAERRARSSLRLIEGARSVAFAGAAASGLQKRGMEERLGMVGFGHRGFGAADHEMGTLDLAATLPSVASWLVLADAVRSLWLRLGRRDG